MKLIQNYYSILHINSRQNISPCRLALAIHFKS